MISMAGELPTGVKIISVLHYIGAVLELLLGIMMFVGAGTIASKIPIIGVIGAGLFAVFGVFLLGIAILSFFVGRGLWKSQKWSRIFVIIFSVVGVLFALFGMVQGKIASNAISLVVSASIGGYLWFNNDVKSAFA